MDTSSLVIGLILGLLCIIPAWLFQRTQNKATRILKKTFKQAATTNNLTISESDMWHNFYSIGLDNSKNKLLYLKHKDSDDQTVIVDLSTIEKCSMDRKTHQTGSGKHSATTINHLDLALIHNDAQHSRDLLEFYDESISSQLNGEPVLLEKWQKLITEKLAKAKV